MARTEVDRRQFIAGGATLALSGVAPVRADCPSAVPDAVVPPPPDPRLPDVGPGQKFAADGQAQTWPGCTLISHVPTTSPLFEALCVVRDSIRSVPVARRKLTWMPEHSHHMTVADLVNIGHRGSRTDWPAALPLDVPLDAACHHVSNVLRRLPMVDARPLRMRLHPDSAASGLRPDGQPRPYILWSPADASQAERLRALRGRVFAAADLHHAGEDRYGYHTTVAYPIGWFTPAEAALYDRMYVQSVRLLDRTLPSFELPVPDFCLFESMYRFSPQFRVG